MLTNTDKKYINAVILSGIFGLIGIHHFYVGRWKMGILDFGLFACTLIAYIQQQYLIAGLSFAIDLIHTVVVTYLLLVGKYKDGKGNIIAYPGQKF